MEDQGVRTLLALTAGYLLAALAFIALRLAGEITWSWVWVLSPLWIPLVLMGVSFVILITARGRADLP